LILLDNLAYAGENQHAGPPRGNIGLVEQQTGAAFKEKAPPKRGQYDLNAQPR
jgi:hypothetical protein